MFASPRHVRFVEMEYGVPLGHLPEAVERVRTLTTTLSFPSLFPIEVRVSAADDIPLSTGFGREKLVRLYARGVELDEELVRRVVARTERVSAAFIKELMRRTAQAAIARGGAKKVVEPGATDLGEALDDMLFSGGQLNVKLLGGAASQHA